MDTEDDAPAAQLVGREIDGYRVVRRLSGGSEGEDDDQTGGSFSYGYEAEGRGGRAFLKAVDLGKILAQPDGKALASRVLGGQESESALLQECAQSGLTRVIAHLAGGTWFDTEHPNVTPVPYVITEWADGGDLRRRLMTQSLRAGFAFAVLHDLAAALSQIHRKEITHGDLKPSNALHVRKRTKLGDFGHAVINGHSGALVMGDAAYAPPEVLYRGTPQTLAERRAVDLYLLGSLLGTIFHQGLPVTALLLRRLPSELHPEVFTGPFEDVKDFLQEEHATIVDIIRGELPLASERDRDLFSRLFLHLCWPDPDLRGMPEEHMGFHDRYALRRVTSSLNLLARRAVEEGSD